MSAWNSTWVPGQMMCFDWLIFKKKFFSEIIKWSNVFFCRNIALIVLYKMILFFYLSKIAVDAGQSLNLDPFGKCLWRSSQKSQIASNMFLCRNFPLMVLYKSLDFIFLSWSEIQDGHHCQTYFNILPYGSCLGKSIQKRLRFKCVHLQKWSFDGPYKIIVFYVYSNPNTKSVFWYGSSFTIQVLF